MVRQAHHERPKGASLAKAASPLILSLSKGERGSWFDKLTMSGPKECRWSAAKAASPLTQ